MSTPAPSDPPVITVPETFREMPRWWHDQPGRTWLDELPSMVLTQCRRWGLAVDGEPLHGTNAFLVPVRRDRQRYALRFSPPGDDIAQEAKALQVWDGRGTVRLFEVDNQVRAMLLERLDSTRSLQSEPLHVAILVIAELIRTLAVPVSDGVPSTAAIAAGHIRDFERDWQAIDGPTPRSQLEVAIKLASERASEPGSALAVDGDLHCRQVLAGDRAPWLVVDPLLLRGDPEYDFARVLWERLDELPDAAEVTDAFNTFVRAAQVPAERARVWIVLRSMSYLLWGIPRGLTWDLPKCQRLLNLFC